MSDPTTTKKKKRSTFSGGLEETLDMIGLLVFVAAIVAALALTFAERRGWMAGVSTVIWALIVWKVLQALAEIIRLQKKAAGLPYAGKISEAEERVDYTCVECGAFLPGETRCESCGRTVEGEA